MAKYNESTEFVKKYEHLKDCGDSRRNKYCSRFLKVTHNMFFETTSRLSSLERFFFIE